MKFFSVVMLFLVCFLVGAQEPMVQIGESVEGSRTISIRVPEEKGSSDTETKIKALESAIQQLKAVADVMKGDKKGVTVEYEEKGHTSIITSEVKQTDAVLMHDDKGNAYYLVPAGTSEQDSKYWTLGNKPFCKDCWKEKKAEVVECPTGH